MHELVKLALDMKKGKITNYTKDEANEVLRQELIELNGGSDKLNVKSFRKHPEMFEIIEQILDNAISEGLTDQYQDFVETIQLDFGDTMVFTQQENRLFNVSVISDGNGDLRRDRMDTGEVTIKTKTYGLAVYEELHRILAGRVSFDRLIDNIARSYNAKIQSDIYSAIQNTFPSLHANFKFSGAYDEAVLNRIISHVETKSQAPAVIMGTKEALGLITRDLMSNEMINDRNRMGYVGMFNGTPMVEIRQVYRAGTMNFAIENNLIIAPTGLQPFVKLVLEGDSLIQETTEGRKDMQRDYTFIKKAGIAVLGSLDYGIYQIR
ncbi:MAG TPA: hypothetical protein VD651_04150 [Nitrosarchaeum sp.]|nr:hypothetical protein [Nitrosarchaeum sp.]